MVRGVEEVICTIRSSTSSVTIDIIINKIRVAQTFVHSLSLFRGDMWSFKKTAAKR
jgi:hypothetical protein